MPNLKGNNKNYSVHPSSFVATKDIGEATAIWAFCNVLEKAKIGKNCNINDHVFIESDVIVGDNVTVKCGVQLWDGLRVEDNVFIGPNATFTNDKFPRSKKRPPEFLITTLKKGSSIGANATLLPGITIGNNAMVGAGSVVTKNVPQNAIVVGNPARIVGYVNVKDSSFKKVLIPSEIESAETPDLGVKGVKLHALPKFNDIRGDLSALEYEKEVPFPVKRIFMVYNVPSVEVRGEHAHRSLHQFLICLRGSVNIVVDDGSSSSEIKLLPFKYGLHVSPKVWSVQYKFSSDALLMVLASDKYDATDYIRNYDEFLEFIGK